MKPMQTIMDAAYAVPPKVDLVDQLRGWGQAKRAKARRECSSGGALTSTDQVVSSCDSPCCRK